MKKKILLIMTALVLGSAAIFRFVLWNNESFLFVLASGLDRPSRTYYAVMERIYYLSKKRDIRGKILKSLEENDNSNAPLLIHILGIIDGEVPSGILIAMYVKHQDDPENKALLGEIVDCMGALGNEDFVPFLNRLLIDYKELNVPVTKYALLRALYLITGEAYGSGGVGNREADLTITQELEDARKVIVATKRRARTLEEMIVIDRVYRPPGW